MTVKYVSLLIFFMWCYEVNGLSANSTGLFQVLNRSKRETETSDNTLRAGRTMYNSDSNGGIVQSLRSTEYKYHAIVQNDGNFVLYHGVTKNIWPKWSSQTRNVGHKPYKLVMQNDNNLVLYDGSGSAIWSSGTVNRGCKPARLIMQNDGNLVLYDGCNSVLWSA